MAQTIIRVKTFMCPSGLGKLGTEGVCRFHRAWDNLPVGNLCPTCNRELVKATLDEDRMTMTVIGEERIDPEIEEMLKDDNRKGEVDTEAKKISHREKRKKDIRLAIIEARRHEDTE